MLRAIARRFPRLKAGLRTYIGARRSLAPVRPSHFRPWDGWLASGPAPLADRGTADVDAINRSSQAYFEQAENREFWLNRPFSDPASAPRVLWRFNLLVSALRPGPHDRILDFGCGTGWTSILLARMGAEVVGMDIAPAALAIASEAADHDLRPSQRGRLTFAAYGGGAIEAHAGSFDAVVVNDAFHHFPNPKQLLAEFHRVLGPHGVFGFSEPGIGHAATAHSEAERAHGVLEEDVDLEQLYRSGKQAGFADLEVLIPALEPEALTLPMDRMRLFLRGVPGVVPADLLRNAVLTGPIGVFRKGPYRATSLHPWSHHADIRPAVRTVSVRTGEDYRIPVDVKNPTETVWLREGRRGIGYVRLGAHLMNPAGKQIELDYGRAELPGDVGPGVIRRMDIVLTAPPAPGTYTVRLDMVNEGVCWFAQTGSPTADVTLDVRG